MSTRIDIEIDESTLKKLVIEYLREQVGPSIKADDISIEVKSKQNYRAEWEVAVFRAKVQKLVRDE